jgi:hypothetical protein
MATQLPPSELLEHLSQHFGLERPVAARIVAEVVCFYDEPLMHFVQRRHAELQHEGLGNADIFKCLQSELSGRLFAAAPLSERQIRRIIYG